MSPSTTWAGIPSRGNRREPARRCLDALRFCALVFTETLETIERPREESGSAADGIATAGGGGGAVRGGGSGGGGSGSSRSAAASQLEPAGICGCCSGTQDGNGGKSSVGPPSSPPP
eukprot:scaffold121595_cov29-Tisochrysis_lutea.AAC.3